MAVRLFGSIYTDEMLPSSISSEQRRKILTECTKRSYDVRKAVASVADCVVVKWFMMALSSVVSSWMVLLLVDSDTNVETR